MKKREQLSLNALRTLLQSIRAGTPYTAFPMTKAALSDVRTGYVDGRPVQRLVITFRGPGCAWVKRGGGCVMCGHYAGTTQGALPSVDEICAQFRNETAAYDMSQFSVLSLYNSGSMLNPAEFPEEALYEIFSVIPKYPSIRKVVLESRAEFVGGSRVKKLRDLLGPDIILSVAIGLETSDDVSRELCINKGTTLADIKRAVTSVKGVAEIQLYVLVGLPFLTEAEAIEDAERSIRCAGDLGAHEIHIEPLTLQNRTLVEILMRHNLYRLPSLYSIYEVLRRVVPDIKPYVSPFMHMPLPALIPQGCPQCTERLVDGLLKRYNIERTSKALDYEYCSCIGEWRHLLEKEDNRPLHKRVSDAVSIIAREV